MRPDQIIIGLLLFSLFVIGGVSIFTSMTDDYSVDVNESIFQGADNVSQSSVYNTVNNIDSITSNISKQISNKEGVSGLTAVGSVVAGVWGVLLLLPQSFLLVSNILNALSESVGIPPFITTILFMIFVVGVLFMIVYIISKATNYAQ